MMALHKAGKPATLALADYIDLVVRLEFFNEDAVARLEVVVAGAQLELTEEFRSFGVRFLEVTRHRLVDAARLDELHQPDLNRVVAVNGGRLALRHNAWTGLEHRHRHHLTVGAEHLRHPDLFAKNSWAHAFFEEVRSEESEVRRNLPCFVPSSRQLDLPRVAYFFSFWPNALISTS